MPRRLTLGPIVLCTTGPNAALSPILQRASDLSGPTASLDDATVSGDIAVTGATLSVALDDATVSGAIDVVRTASMIVNLDDDTVSGTAAVTDGITITLPPANYSVGEATARTTGRHGCHLSMHYFRLVDTTRYVYWTRAGNGIDPGPYAAELSGLTGIEVDLPATPQTASQNAAAVASAIDAVGGLTGAESGDDVVITGATGAVAGGTDIASAGRQGIFGTPDNRAFDDSSFGAPTLGGHALDPARIGSVPIVITGAAIGMGDTTVGANVLAVYQQQGVQPDTEQLGAVLLGVIGLTSASGTNVIERIECAEGVYADPSLGTIWIMTMGPAGNDLMYSYSTRDGTTGHDWVQTVGDRFYTTVGPATSDPNDLPATLTATNGNTSGVIALQVSFVDAALFQNDMQPLVEVGSLAGLAAGERDASFEFSTSYAGGFVDGNRYVVPSDMRGLEVYSCSMNYSAHTNDEDIRCHVAIMPSAATNDWSGGTVHDVGRATGVLGTELGWVETAVAPTGIALAAGTHFFLLEESDGAYTTAGAYDTSGASAVFEADVWGDAPMYQGSATECGYDPLESPFIDPGEETTNLQFDPTTAYIGTGQSVAEAIAPDGLRLNGSGNASVRATLITRGWAGVA